MGEKLKPCPFCGKMPEVEPNGDCYCDYYICPMAPDSYMPKDWNTRPIEDALRARIAELEAEIYQLTVHSDIERQDDKWIPEVQG